MRSWAFIFISLLLVCSVSAEEKSHHESKKVSRKIKGDLPIHTYVSGGGYGGGYGGQGGGGGGANVGGGDGGAGGQGGGQVGDQGAGGGQGGDQGAGGGAAAAGASTGGYSAGFSHGGAYGGGKICYFGCCSESYGYSHPGGGYYSCSCCKTAAEAEAYKESIKAKAEIKN